MEIDYAKLPPTAESLEKILECLRAPGGCPWDREQTRETLSRCLAEECAELLDAIDGGDPAEICDELGDVLMNVVFQAVVGKERGEFTLQDVVANVNAKMIRRHAHIFGTERAETAEDVVKIWEKVKATEKRPVRESILDGMPSSLSALSTAEKIQKKVSKVGFDWRDEGSIVEKIEEELGELKEGMARGDGENVEEEMGDLLFAVVNLARYRGGRSAEELLRGANGKFRRRFGYIERELKRGGRELAEATPEEMEELWQAAKQQERG